MFLPVKQYLDWYLSVILFGVHKWFWGDKPAGLGHSWSEEKHIKPETSEANSLTHIKMAALDTHARSYGVFCLVVFLGWTSKHCLLKHILAQEKQKNY